VLYSHSQNATPHDDAVSKLSKCRTSLQRWSKGKLGDSAAQIKQKTQEVEVLQRNEGPENSEEIKN
jgi:muramidase (phage lysozyme)